MDMVLFEGWRVGIDHPLYKPFNAAIDCLVCLEADIEAIRTWKVQSSRRDAETAGKPFDEKKINEAFDRDIVPFVELYEKPLLKRAALVLRKAASHSILRLDCALIEKVIIHAYPLILFLLLYVNLNSKILILTRSFLSF